MEKFPMCRICLVKDIHMYTLVNKELHELYEKLTDIPFVTEDSRPILLCLFCCTKLKQCYQLLKKCLIAEELLAQMMNEDCEHLVNQDMDSFRRLIKTPIKLMSIIDKPEMESIVIKEELPDVSVDIIVPKEEIQSDDLEPETVDNTCIHLECKLPHHSESHTNWYKIEVEELEEESKPKIRAAEINNLEPGNIYNSGLDGEDVPAPHSESDSEGDVPLMRFKTEWKEELDISNNKRRSVETIRACVAKKPKLDARRRNLEDTIAAALKRKEQLNLEAIRTSNNLTAESDTYLEKSNKRDVCTANQINKLKPGGKSYKCDVCQRSFGQQSNLTSHMRIHTGEKPYKCDICQRSFSIKDTLTKHRRVHTGEKPNKCDICQISFNQKSALKKHIRIHTSEKPYKCDVCQSSFNHKSYLTRHMRIHTGGKPYQCEVCLNRFTRMSGLMKHSKSHLVKKPVTDINASAV